MKKNNFALLTLLMLSILFFSSCDSLKEDKIITLATTTSTRDSGLLDYILPDFEKNMVIGLMLLLLEQDRH